MERTSSRPGPTLRLGQAVGMHGSLARNGGNRFLCLRQSRPWQLKTWHAPRPMVMPRVVASPQSHTAFGQLSVDENNLTSITIQRHIEHRNPCLEDSTPLPTQHACNVFSVPDTFLHTLLGARYAMQANRRRKQNVQWCNACQGAWHHLWEGSCCAFVGPRKQLRNKFPMEAIEDRDWDQG